MPARSVRTLLETVGRRTASLAYRSATVSASPVFRAAFQPLKRPAISLLVGFPGASVPAVAATVPTVPTATIAVAVAMAARLVMERRVIAVSSAVRGCAVKWLQTLFALVRARAAAIQRRDRTSPIHAPCLLGRCPR